MGEGRPAGEGMAGNHVMSKKMGWLAYGNRKLVAGILLLIFGLSCALAGLMLDQDARRGYREERNLAVPFDPSGPGGYSYVRLQYLTDSFAEHVKSEENYFFGFDFMFRPYIISMKGHVPDNLTALIDYTYGDGLSEPPPAVDVYGYGRPIVSEMLGYAREYYSQLWEETQLPITMEDLTQIVGNHYLDTVPRTYLEQYPWSVLFYVVPALILILGGIRLFRYFRGMKAQSAGLSGRPDGLRAADLELQCTDEAVKGSRVYLTEHFIVTSFYRFDVIPYTCIDRLETSGGFVIAVTKDGYAHIVSGGRHGGQILGMIQKKQAPEQAGTDIHGQAAQ